MKEITYIYFLSNIFCNITELHDRCEERIYTCCGITLKAVVEVSNDVTDTTIRSMGSALRLTMVCRDVTIWLARTIGSFVVCGHAPWPPTPLT